MPQSTLRAHSVFVSFDVGVSGMEAKDKSLGITFSSTTEGISQRPGGQLFRGFSLIELLVVLAIIAILARLTYPSYRQHQLRSVVTEARLSLQTMATTQEQMRLKRGRYQSLDELLLHVSLSERINQHYALDLKLPNDGLAFRLSMVPRLSEETLPTLTLDHWGQFSSEGWLL